MRCTRCDRKLKEKDTVWLELDTRTNTYTSDFVPEKHSQGGFSFGKTCAKIETKAHHKAQNQQYR